MISVLVMNFNCVILTYAMVWILMDFKFCWNITQTTSKQTSRSEPPTRDFEMSNETIDVFVEKESSSEEE